jgi:hypothetical protein
LLGEVLGKIIGGAVTVISLALSGLLDIVTSCIWAVNSLKDAFVLTGIWIGETAAKIYIWFSETLPNAIKSAIRSVVGFYNAAADTVMRIVQSVRSALDAVWGYLVSLLSSVPDALLPESLERFRSSMLAAETATGRSPTAIDRFTASSTSPAAATRSMPATAEATSRMGEFTRFEAGRTGATNAKESSQSPVFTVNVQVDGETIARAVNNAEQSNAARAFSPLPVY